MTGDNGRTAAESWQQIVDMTEKIQNLARAKDWREMDRVAARRDRLLKRFFRREPEEPLRSRVMEDLRAIREKDQETIRLVQKNKDLLAEELSRLQVQRKRITDYISNSE